jgi:DNA-directed RNA polymerase subunit F
MDEGTLNSIQQSVDALTKIKEYDNQLRLLQVQAKLFAEDMHGKNTNTDVSAEFLDVQKFLEELREKEAKDSETFNKLSSIEPAMGLLGMINPIESEKVAKVNNSSYLKLKLDPSESLLLIEVFKNIILNRKKRLITKLQDICPTVSLDLK